MKFSKSLLILVLLAGAGGLHLLTSQQVPSSPPTASVVADAPHGVDGQVALMDAYDRRISKIWLVVEGTVKRRLPDDQTGSRHQRFILELPNQHTVLVAHNIDLAQRVPLSQGDRVKLRGRYEWNRQGGVLHWTHHDPKGHIQGGWIKYQGRQYQ